MKTSNLIRTLFLATLATLLGVAAMAQPAGYLHSFPIAIAGSQVAGASPHSDFPIMLSLQNDRLRHTSSGGFMQHASGWDVAVTLSDHTTMLDVQLESYNPTLGSLVLWARIPTLTPAVDDTLYLYYSNSSVSTNPSTSAVWNAGFTSVWHLDGNPAGAAPQMTDGTSSAENLTVTGTPIPTSITGIAGPALDFNGAASAGYLQLASPLPSTLQFSGSTSITMEGWMRLPAGGLNEDMCIVMKGSGVNDEKYFLGASIPGDEVTMRIETPTGFTRLNGGTIPEGEWVYLSATYDGSRMRAYLNNTLVIDQAKTGGIIHDATDDIRVAGRHDTRRFSGDLDEIRISNVVRSTDWMTTTYNNIANASTFASLVDTTPPPGAPQVGDFARHARLCLDETLVSGSSDLSDFPVLIDLTHDSLRTLANGGVIRNANGYDVLFTASDQTTHLDFEIESYDGSTGHLRAWVKVPTLHHDINTEIHLYYGRPGTTTNPSTTATWSNGYEAVYHFTGTSLDDSGPNGRHGTNNGSTTTTGPLGGARSFTAGSHRVEIGTWNVAGSAITMSAWVNHPTIVNNDPRLISKGNGGGAQQQAWYIGQRNGVTPTVGMRVKTGTADNSGSTTINDGSQIISAGVWQHYAATYDGANMRTFLNGVQSNSAAKTGTLRQNGWAIWIGNQPGATRSFNGSIDEVRVANVARSADWLRTEYNMQSDAANTLVCMDFEENSTLPVVFVQVQGSTQGSQQAVQWRIASQRNTSHYVVLAGQQADDLQPVGQLHATGPEVGHKTYTLALPQGQHHTFAQVVGVDHDGLLSHSPVVALQPAALQLRAFPNPTTGQVTLQASTSLDQVPYTLLDQLGREVATGVIGGDGKVSLSTLQPGTYVLLATTPGGTTPLRIVKR